MELTNLLLGAVELGVINLLLCTSAAGVRELESTRLGVIVSANREGREDGVGAAGARLLRIPVTFDGTTAAERLSWLTRKPERGADGNSVLLAFGTDELQTTAEVNAPGLVPL